MRARELDRTLEITVALADGYPNFSICGLPFFLSGETPDWNQLAHRTEFAGVSLRLWHRARSINTAGQIVELVDRENHTIFASYNRLIIATGAVPTVPQIPGVDLPGVHTLHTMEDSFRIDQRLREQSARSVVIVGAGYIGVEMADALSHRRIPTILVGKTPSILQTVDTQFGQLIAAELRRNNVELHTNIEVQQIRRSESSLEVIGSNGFQASADMVLLATGVKPDSELAKSAGIRTGVRDAIRVDGCMRTNLPDIYAAGDCAETWHHILQESQYSPLGTTSHKQGRVAGENAVGGDKHFRGTVGTQVVKVFNLVIARTGLLDLEASAAGFNPRTTEIEAWDHKTYYPGAQSMRIRVTGDVDSGRLLGAQIIGSWRSEVAKRIDIFATALFHNMSVEAVNDLDLSYTPPLSSPWDPVQLAAQAWCQDWPLRPGTMPMHEVTSPP